jgi:hypothetical protein
MKIRNVLSFSNVIAFIIWVVGSYNTVVLLEELGVSTESYTSLYAGVVTQFIFTYCQSVIWFEMNLSKLDKEKIIQYILFGFLVLIDIAANVGGIIIYVNNISATSAYQALFGTEPISAGLIRFIAILVGTIIAIAPEAIYRSK